MEPKRSSMGKWLFFWNVNTLKNLLIWLSGPSSFLNWRRIRGKPSASTYYLSSQAELWETFQRWCTCFREQRVSKAAEDRSVTVRANSPTQWRPGPDRRAGHTVDRRGWPQHLEVSLLPPLARGHLQYYVPWLLTGTWGSLCFLPLQPWAVLSTPTFSWLPRPWPSQGLIPLPLIFLPRGGETQKVVTQGSTRLASADLPKQGLSSVFPCGEKQN